MKSLNTFVCYYKGGFHHTRISFSGHLLTSKEYPEDLLATIGRLYVCLIISDLVVIDTDANVLDFYDGVIMSLVTKKRVIQIGQKKGMFKTKKLEKFSKWFGKNTPKLHQKKIKVIKNEIFSQSVKHYITKYLNDHDPQMKELYLAEPRIRIAIDSMSVM